MIHFFRSLLGCALRSRSELIAPFATFLLEDNLLLFSKGFLEKSTWLRYVQPGLNCFKLADGLGLS